MFFRLGQVGALFAAVAFMFTGCKRAQRTDLQSYLGMEAGLDDGVKNTSGAPTFVALSAWFQNFTVSATGQSTGTKVTMHDVKTRLPAAYRPGLIAYIDHELSRNTAFRTALAQADSQKLQELLADETDEMYDIIMVILNSRYQPTTGDLFAKFIKVTRGTSTYIDRFALAFLDQALQARVLNDVEAHLHNERDAYLVALKKLYLDNDNARLKLASDLQKEAVALQSMRNVLSGSGMGLWGDSSAPQGEFSGTAAAFSQFEDDFVGYAASGAAGGAPQLAVFSLVPNDPQQKAADQKGMASTGNAYSSGGYQGPGSSSGPNGNFGPQNGNFAPGGGGFAPSQNNSQAFNPLGAIIPAEWFSDDTELTANPIQPLDSILPGPPRLDCTKLKLTGTALITCQRYYAYANTQFTPRRIPATHGAFLTGSNGNASMVYNFSSPVQEQGSVPSCSAHGLSHTGEVAAREAGKAVTLDAKALWDAQGQSPSLEASLESASSGWPNTTGGNVSVASENPVSSQDDMIQAIDQGHAVYVGISIGQDWTSGGGGAEFQLSGSGIDANIVSCGDGPGHAVSLQGYVNYNGRMLFVGKNSWGDTWGDQGYFYLDWTNCQAGSDAYAPTFKVQ